MSVRASVWLVVVSCLVLLSASFALGASLVVTNVNDNGAGSLREAIDAANASPGSSITFAPSLTGRTIVLQGNLPAFSAGNTSIDGDTNGDGKPDILIDGAHLATWGLLSVSSNNAIRHLAICRTKLYGILISNWNGMPNANTVEGCNIGTNITGTQPLGLGTNNSESWNYGVLAYATNSVVTGCVVGAISSGNASGGVSFVSGGGNTITSNWIGTNPAGANLAIGNGPGGGGPGVGIYNSITNRVAGNVIANIERGVAIQGDGLEANTGNVVSGNNIGPSSWTGVFVESPRTTATIQGNTIHDIGNTGVLVESGASVTIDGNTMTNASIGVGSQATVPSISANTITGRGLVVTGGATVPSISSNTITGGGLVITDGAKVASINGNTIQNHTDGAVNISGAAGPINIADNKIRNMKFGIFSYQCPQVNVRNNEFRQMNTYYDLSIHQANGCVIEGNQMDAGPYAGIWLTTVPNATVSGNTITGGACSYGAQIGVTSSSTNVTVSNNILSGSGAHGITVYGGSTGSVTSNTISQCAAEGINVANTGTNVTLTANTISDAGDNGIFLFDSALSPAIKSNTISRSQSNGISLQNVTNTTVSDNILTGGTRGIYADTCSSTLTRNKISGASESAISARAGTAQISNNEVSGGSWAGIVVCSGCKATIDGNKVSACGGAGIRVVTRLVTPGTNALVLNNIVQDSGAEGISFCGGATGSVKDNVITKPKATGIALTGTDTSATVTGNTVTDAGSYGVGVNGSARAQAITTNVVSGSKQDGIIVSSGTGDLISHNTVSDSVADGIALSGAGAATISDNTVTGGRRGIVSTATPVDVARNKISGVSELGIAANAATATISNNEVRGGSWAGIVTCSGCQAKIEGNKVSACDGAGIRVVTRLVTPGTNALVLNNIILDCGAEGIAFCGGATGTVEDNVITKPKATGIALSGTDTSATVTGNTVTDAGSDGVSIVGGASAIVTKNKVSAPSGSGINANAGTVTISENEVSGGLYSGIGVCGGCQATVRDNKVTASRGVGIGVVRAGTTAEVLSNTVQECAKAGVSFCGGATGSVQGNTLHNNAGGGVVALRDSTRVRISNNSIYDNGGLGIDLAVAPDASEGDGVTPNGVGGTGPNKLMNFPVVSSVQVEGASVLLTGTAPAGATIEVFKAAPDPSGYGEGKTFLKTATASGDGTFSLGVTPEDLPITMTATDAEGNTSEFSRSGLPIVADAGPDQTVEANAAGGANVTLDGSGSQDPNGGTATYLWTWQGADDTAQQATGINPTVLLPLGDTVVTLVVSEGQLSSLPDTVTVTVKDTTGPTVNDLTASPDELWPPNGKMRDVVLSYTLADVIDANPSVTLSVTCNEADFVEADDVKLVDAKSLQLRAKRDGKSKDGRIYSITLTAKDATGNESETVVTVTVPHDQGAANKGLALALTGLASTGKGGVSQITVQSSAPAEATVAVANIAGRHIATLAPKTLQSGLNTLLWNGKSAAGTSVPSGRYLVTVTACGTEGTKTHCMIPLQR